MGPSWEEALGLGFLTLVTFVLVEPRDCKNVYILVVLWKVWIKVGTEEWVHDCPEFISAEFDGDGLTSLVLSP